MCEVRTDVKDCDSSPGKGSTQGTTVVVHIVTNVSASVAEDSNTFGESDNGNLISIPSITPTVRSKTHGLTSGLPN